jgi:predicted PolB exonuclease-like 3'-5' exonuclease
MVGVEGEGGSGRKREQGGGETELPLSLSLVCAVCARWAENYKVWVGKTVKCINRR